MRFDVRTWWGGVRRFASLELDLVFPPDCGFCRVELEPGSGQRLCEACRTMLTDARPSCPRCGAWMPVPHAGEGCPKCQEHRFHFQSVVRLGGYEGAMRSAVLRIKRPQERILATALGRLLATTAGSQLAQFQPDVVVPVPMHWTRKAWRGTNSPETIARQLAEHLKLPLRGELVARRRRTVPQASLTPPRRAANVRGAFRAAAHPDLKGACVLLVDDIMTTGATVNEAAKVLAKAGASRVVVAVLARAEGLG